MTLQFPAKKSHYILDRILKLDAGGDKQPFGWLFRVIRVWVFTIDRFSADRCYLRASALTFYCALSIVPIGAMLFGIAKGFGLDNLLRKKLEENFSGHQEVLNWIIKFSESLLQNTRGEMIAGAGLLILFWTLIRVAGNIEESFNNVWRVKRARSIVRKLTDYLSMTLFCPAVILAAGSINVFLTAHIAVLAEDILPFSGVNIVLYHSLKLLPFVMACALFTFVYMFVPNIKVPLKAGICGGIVCGILFQALQSGYIFVQVALSKYNAVYGSFSALPLFLIWLQLSWLIVLFGAEMSYVANNLEACAFERENTITGDYIRKIFSARALQIIAKAFDAGAPPLDAREIAAGCKIPVPLASDILKKLAGAAVLRESCVRQAGPYSDERVVYQLALPPDKISLSELWTRMEDFGRDTIELENDAELWKIQNILGAFRSENEKSKANVTLAALSK